MHKSKQYNLQNQQTEKLDNKLVGFWDFITTKNKPQFIDCDSFYKSWNVMKPSLSNLDVRKITPATATEDAKYKTKLGHVPT